MYGWDTYHTYDSRRSDPGFPDLVMIRPPRLVFAELKSSTGILGAAQTHWQEQLSGVRDIESYVWRPLDLQHIADTLR